MVKGVPGYWGIKDNFCPCQFIHYVKKVDKLSIPNYYAHTWFL